MLFDVAERAAQSAATRGVVAKVIAGGPVLRLSILVPFRGNPKRFEDTLVSVLENRPERSEVVVVTNRPYDDPYDLRGEVAFAEALKNADLLVCFATGLAVSHGQVVHLLGEGFEATPGWAEAALARFDEPDVAAVVPLVLDRQRPERIVFAGLCYASSGAIARIGTGGRADHFASNEQTLGGPELGASFYRRDALAAVGSLPNYGSECAAAVDLALSLRSLGYRCVQAADCVMTATGDLLAPASGWRDGLAEERLFRYWAAGTSSAAPSRSGWKPSRFAHAALVAGEVVQIPLRPKKLARLAGRLCAALASGAGRLPDVCLGGPVSASAIVRSGRFTTAE